MRMVLTTFLTRIRAGSGADAEEEHHQGGAGKTLHIVVPIQETRYSDWSGKAAVRQESVFGGFSKNVLLSALIQDLIKPAYHKIRNLLPARLSNNPVCMVFELPIGCYRLIFLSHLSYH
jgi:hypothetical protein